MRIVKKEVVKKTLRLVKEDSELLYEKAKQAGMNENEYLRMLIRERPADMPEVRGLIKSLINEVNHIGVNVNQIAKNSNAGYFGSADKQQILAYMQKLNTAVRQVVEKLGNQ